MKKIKDMMMPEGFYQKLDKGIRFAVRVLHAKGFETCQSCQGGKGHCYNNPTIDLISSGDDSWGFAAISALQDYGIIVTDISLHWSVRNGFPYDRIWRIELANTLEERAEQTPIFIHGYISQ